MEFSSFKKYECPEDLFSIVIAPCWQFEYRSRPTFKTLVKLLSEYTLDGDNEVRALRFSQWCSSRGG